MGAAEGWKGGATEEVARRTSFWVASRSTSRVRRSFSESICVFFAEREESLTSRSRT